MVISGAAMSAQPRDLFGRAEQIKPRFGTSASAFTIGAIFAHGQTGLRKKTIVH
jgi:hypothetical protein